MQPQFLIFNLKFFKQFLMTEFSNKEEYIEETDFEYKEGGGWKEKFWDFIGGKYFVPIAIILVAIIAFSLGRISGLQEKRSAVKIISESAGEIKGASVDTSPPTPSPNLGEGSSAPSESGGSAQPSQNATAGTVVASKNGTKYHYPWCAGAKQISDKNKITFESIEAARAAGYSPASNCKGLK